MIWFFWRLRLTRLPFGEGEFDLEGFSRVLAPAGLTCTSDYNRTITCAWSGTDESDRADAPCALRAALVNSR